MAALASPGKLLTDSRVIKYKIETGVVYPFNLVQVVESGKRVLDILCGDSGRESAQMEYAGDTGSHRRGINTVLCKYLVVFNVGRETKAVEGSKLSLPLAFLLRFPFLIPFRAPGRVGRRLNSGPRRQHGIGHVRSRRRD